MQLNELGKQKSTRQHTSAAVGETCTEQPFLTNARHYERTALTALGCQQKGP